MITADSLRVFADFSGVDLFTNATNIVTNLGVVTLAAGAQFAFKTSVPTLTVTNTVTSTGGITVENVTGGIVIDGGAFNGGAGNVSLTTAGAITQSAFGAITANVLTLSTGGNSATLNAATNAISSLGTTTLGSGALNLLDAGSLTVSGAVTATGGITLNTSGALAINGTLSGGANTVSLTTTGSGNAITQNASGVITAGTLTITTTNASATLNTATNAVTNLGAVSLGTGALNLLDAGGLSVTGAVGATGGITLNTSGALAINATLSGGSNTVSLTTTGIGNIAQNASGVITADTLNLTTNAGSATLDTATNAIPTWARCRWVSVVR